MSNDKIIVKLDKDLEDIIPDYLKKRESDIPKLREALKVNDFATLQSLGHKLKGTGGAYGFPPLGDAGKEIEDSAKAKNPSNIEEQINKIEHYLTHIEIIYEES